MSDKSVTLTINGQEVSVPEGTNLIEAAKTIGFAPAHFCYHPALSIVGQCRMCLCEIENVPKLQIACNTPVKDGMIVHFNNERVTQAVKNSLEFHMINHPIDCPICDQSGECVLQDYYMVHGKYVSEMHEPKVLKRKVVDLGDKIVLDQERCILCSRCVRYTAEVSRTSELGYFNRGDRAVIATVNDKPLTGNYQENLVDVCPVGALTSKDFRFECRVWYLNDFDTICTGCSKGCSTKAYHKNGQRFFRQKPVFNPDVNGYWNCDTGRYMYKLANFDSRFVYPSIGVEEVEWDVAIGEIARHFARGQSSTPPPLPNPDRTALWISPQLTNEEVLLAFNLFNKNLGLYRFFSEDLERITKEDGDADGFLFRKDQNPNTAGLRKLAKQEKLNVGKTEFLIQLLESSSIDTLFIIAPENLSGCPAFDTLCTHLPADLFTVTIATQTHVVQTIRQGVFLPTLSWLEKNGSIINCDGKVQTLKGPFKMFESTKSLYEIAQDLSTLFDRPLSFNTQSEFTFKVKEAVG